MPPLTLPGPLGGAALYLLFGLLIAGLVVRRVPVVRTLVSLATWACVAVLLVGLLGQRAAIDPYLARIASVFKLEGQEITGKEVRIRMSPDGHFWAHVTLDGVKRRMLVDSGATITAISDRTAAAAGLAVADGPFPVLLNTANGTIRAQTARVGEMRLGNVVARDIPVVVSPTFAGMDVLGMNFLSRLKSWRVEERTLVLTPHHPRDARS